MKSKTIARLILAITLVGMTAWGAGCRGRSEDKGGTAPPQVQQRPEMSGTAEPETGKAPRLGLSVNQLSEVDSYPGWPIRVELGIWHPRIYHPEAKAQPMAIAAPGESWAEAIKLTVRNSAGNPVNIPLRLLPQPENTLTLDAEKGGDLTWWVAGDDTKSIPEGDYQLVATLDTRSVRKPGIWQGRVESEPAVLHLKKEPSPLTDEQAEEKLLLLAACAQALGEGDKAKEHVDALLAARPESIQGLALKAGLLETAGDKAGALKAYESALDIFYRKYPKADPPLGLWENHKRLLGELMKINQ